MNIGTIINKEAMRTISLGIAAEMTDEDTAKLIADNGKSGDKRISVFEILRPTSGFKHGLPIRNIFETVLVAATNGDPIWEESDAAAFAELMETEGIEL